MCALGARLFGAVEGWGLLFIKTGMLLDVRGGPPLRGAVLAVDQGRVSDVLGAGALPVDGEVLARNLDEAVEAVIEVHAADLPVRPVVSAHRMGVEIAPSDYTRPEVQPYPNNAGHRVAEFAPEAIR